MSAGVKPGADAIKVLTLANTLAVGGLATTGETVDLLTTAINTYGLNAKQAAVATDQFAEAIALGKVTAAEIAETFAVVGPMAQSMGIGIDEIAAAYATLTAKGIPAAEAMTDMRSAIAGLAKPTASLNKAQKDLGVNFAKIAKEKGLQVAMQRIVDYSKKTGIPLAKLLGRIEAVQYALTTTGANANDYKNALKEVQSATGTAEEQMSERQGGLNFQLQLLKANARDAAITIGSKLLPKLTPLAKKAVDFLQAHEADIEKFGDTIASGFDKAADFANKIPWSQVGQGLKIAADWAGVLMDTFAHLPPEAQSTIIALAGLNKLSGGAITGIVGELGKGLIKGVLGINAAVVNVNGGVVNGAGGVASAAAGAATAAGGVGLGTVATVAAVPVILAGGSALGLQKLAEYAGKNNLLAEKGLNFSEITAVKFYTSSLAEQQTAAKHLGYLPNKADFASGMAKIATADAASGKSIVGAIGNVTPEISRLGTNVVGAIGNVTPEISRLGGKMDATKGAVSSVTTAVGLVRAAVAAQQLSVAIQNVIPIALNAIISNRENSKVNASFSRAYSTGKFAI